MTEMHLSYSRFITPDSARSRSLGPYMYDFTPSHPVAQSRAARSAASQSLAENLTAICNRATLFFAKAHVTGPISCDGNQKALGNNSWGLFRYAILKQAFFAQSDAAAFHVE